MQGSSRVTAALLRDLPTFTGLSDAQLERISEIAVIEELPAQQALLRQGGPAHTLRIVVTGKLSLCIELGGGHERCLVTMTRGEVVGWSALLDQATWLASVTAIKPSTVLAIDGATLRGLCEADHELGYHVMRNLFTAVAARLQDTRLQLLDTYGHA